MRMSKIVVCPRFQNPITPLSPSALSCVVLISESGVELFLVCVWKISGSCVTRPGLRAMLHKFPHSFATSPCLTVIRPPRLQLSACCTVKPSLQASHVDGRLGGRRPYRRQRLSQNCSLDKIVS